MKQMELNFLGEVEDPYREAALEWIETNPDAWNAMVQRGIDLLRVDAFVGMKALLEWARCEMPLRRVEGEMFAINNNLAPAMARIMLERHPEFDGRLRTRHAKQDELAGRYV